MILGAIWGILQDLWEILEDSLGFIGDFGGFFWILQNFWWFFRDLKDSVILNFYGFFRILYNWILIVNFSVPFFHLCFRYPTDWLKNAIPAKKKKCVQSAFRIPQSAADRWKGNLQFIFQIAGSVKQFRRKDRFDTLSRSVHRNGWQFRPIVNQVESSKRIC